MEYRVLGNTGLSVSVLGFGCGNVGGLMVRGDPKDQVAAVARAVEAGINYFDTAAQYGDGQSETNLGRMLNELRPDVYVGTKVRAAPDDVKGSILRSVEASLRRLSRDSVDLIQLHNNIGGRGLTVQQVLGDVREAFEQLQRAGQVRFYGITGLGDTTAVHQVVNSGSCNTVQVAYNLLNPSADGSPSAHQDFEGLLGKAATVGMGTIGIRVLAGGALAGVEERHPIASSAPSPIGTSSAYGEDVQRAERFRFLVEKGYAIDLPDAALRFAMSNPQLSTALAGLSDRAQLEAAIASAERGPLADAALQELRAASQRA